MKRDTNGLIGLTTCQDTSGKHMAFFDNGIETEKHFRGHTREYPNGYKFIIGEGLSEVEALSDLKNKIAATLNDCYQLFFLKA